MTVCCSNTDQYSKDVEGKLNVVFVVRNIGNDQEYKVSVEMVV